MEIIINENWTIGYDSNSYSVMHRVPKRPDKNGEIKGDPFTIRSHFFARLIDCVYFILENASLKEDVKTVEDLTKELKNTANELSFALTGKRLCK